MFWLKFKAKETKYKQYMKGTVFSNPTSLGWTCNEVLTHLYRISHSLLGNHSAYLLSDGFAVQLVVYLPDSCHC